MFTKEELQIIEQFLTSAPIQGTFQTLPELLEKIAGILKKVGVQLEDLNHENS